MERRTAGRQPHPSWGLILALILLAFILLVVRPAAGGTGRSLDLVFVLDTTGSMSGEIREATQQVRSLAVALQKSRPGARVRIGVVAYRDRGDAYVTRVAQLSAEAQRSFDFLSGLTADGGGDGPENVLAGLTAALDRIDWDAASDVDRELFLIGDAPPHLDYRDELPPEELFRRARSRRIVINAIGCRSLPPDGVAFFRRAAYATEGTYQHIGRVELGNETGLAEAVLTTVAPDAGVETPGEPVPAHLTATDADATATGVDAEHVANGGKSCGVVLRTPVGLAVEGAPRIEHGREGLRIFVRLVAGQGERRSYGFPSCVPLSTPIHVRLEER
jgi:hypothetical protein